MRQTLVLIAALLAGVPAIASPEEDAAMAYCAAKAAGRSDKEASDAAAIQISRGRGLGYVMFYGQQVKDQVQYLIERQCPDAPGFSGECRYDINGRYQC